MASRRPRSWARDRSSHRRRGGSRLSRLWPLGVYLLLLAALFVRFQPPDTFHPRPLDPTLDELRVVRRHHRTFYAILLAAIVEWLVRGCPHDGLQVFGAALFLAGVIGYRRAGRALGDQLSPLVNPREPAVVVDRGPYRRVRHPMYRAEIAMAFGAPVSLGAFATLALSTAFAGLVLYRIHLEERALTRRADTYRDYAARTHRLFPHLY